MDYFQTEAMTNNYFLLMANMGETILHLKKRCFYPVVYAHLK